MKNLLLRAFSYVLVAAVAVAATLTIVVMSDRGGMSKLDQLEAIIDSRFIEDTDLTALEDAAADAMVAATGDRWSYYISASEYGAYMEQMNNAYVGVGITIELLEGGQGYLIREVTPGGPAEEAGVQAGDILVMVDGQDIREMESNALRDRVRGKAGTSVSLGFDRQGETVILTVERREVQTPVATCEMLEGDIGLVTIENFDARCAQESIDAVEALLAEGAEKIIFDVRYNPGGYAHELVELLDYLLPEGELFRAVSYDGSEDIDYSDEEFLDVPMAVLVNASSYSAAEFFAAALREYEAAIVVGEATVGKGYFQTTYRLNDGSAVALSVGKYYTPKGFSLANVGITPDVVVPVDEETGVNIYYNLLEAAEDPQIQAAVEALNRLG